jgi:hypothetical protein
MEVQNIAGGSNLEKGGLFLTKRKQLSFPVKIFAGLEPPDLRLNEYEIRWNHEG